MIHCKATYFHKDGVEDGCSSFASLCIQYLRGKSRVLRLAPKTGCLSNNDESILKPKGKTA